MKYIKHVLVLFILISVISCIKKSPNKIIDVDSEKSKIHVNLDLWHNAAAEANFDAYFNLMTSDGVFIGTDATENWQNNAFKNFSKPHFDKGKAWNFTPLQRNIYVSKDSEIAWFDELLDTQMGICRGSGIMKVEDGQWKVSHYVLSITIPNDQVKQIVEIKKELDSLLIRELSEK